MNNQDKLTKAAKGLHEWNTCNSFKIEMIIEGVAFRAISDEIAEHSEGENSIYDVIERAVENITGKSTVVEVKAIPYPPDEKRETGESLDIYEVDNSPGAGVPNYNEIHNGLLKLALRSDGFRVCFYPNCHKGPDRDYKVNPRVRELILTCIADGLSVSESIKFIQGELIS